MKRIADPSSYCGDRMCDMSYKSNGERRVVGNRRVREVAGIGYEDCPRGKASLSDQEEARHTYTCRTSLHTSTETKRKKVQRERETMKSLAVLVGNSILKSFA